MKKTIYLLLICLTGITFSCSEDDYNHQGTDTELGTNFQKRTITFNEMKEKLNGKDVKILKRDIVKKGGDDYIVSIDSTYVTEIINDSLVTYTLRVYTKDEENYTYSNLVIKNLNDDVEEYIIHYIPTPEWQIAYNAGNHIDYQGEIILTDTNGNNIEGTSKAPCTFSIESVVVCTCEGHVQPDTSCTCTTFTDYYYLKMTCGNGSPNGGGSGNGSGSGDGGDFGLPTLPHGGQQGGGGSGNYNYSAFNTEFIPLLTMPQINWLENHPDIFLQIYNYLESYGEPTEYGWYDNYEAVEFAAELVGILEEQNYTKPVYTTNDYPGIDDNMPFNWWSNIIWINNNIRIDGLKPEEKPNPQEIILFALFPKEAALHIKNSINALNTAQNLVTEGMFTRIHNGKADAFRHTFWNALDSSDFGIIITLLFTTAHERGAAIPNHPLEMTMDLLNNATGAQIGTNYNIFTSSEVIKGTVINAMQNTSTIWYLTPLANHDGNNILSNTIMKPTNQ